MRVEGRRGGGRVVEGVEGGGWREGGGGERVVRVEGGEWRSGGWRWRVVSGGALGGDEVGTSSVSWSSAARKSRKSFGQRTRR